MQGPLEPNRVDPQCAGCPGCAADGSVAEPDPDAPLEGFRFVVASAGIFLVPLGLAILGATLMQSRPGGGLLGALAGLATGMALAAGVARSLGRFGKEDG